MKLHPDFVLRDDKIHCRYCSQWTKQKWADKAFHHDRDCPSVAKTAVDSAATKSEPVASPIVARARELQSDLLKRAAKSGEVSKVLTDSEIVDAAAVGAITVDDAMNRDF